MLKKLDGNLSCVVAGAMVSPSERRGDNSSAPFCLFPLVWVLFSPDQSCPVDGHWRKQSFAEIKKKTYTVSKSNNRWSCGSGFFLRLVRVGARVSFLWKFVAVTWKGKYSKGWTRGGKDADDVDDDDEEEESDDDVWHIDEARCKAVASLFRPQIRLLFLNGKVLVVVYFPRVENFPGTKEREGKPRKSTTFKIPATILETSSLPVNPLSVSF